MFSSYVLLPPIFMFSCHQSYCIQFETASYSILFKVIPFFLCVSQCKSKVLNSPSQRDSSFHLSKRKSLFLGTTVTQSSSMKGLSVLMCWIEKTSQKCVSFSKDKFGCVRGVTLCLKAVPQLDPSILHPSSFCPVASLSNI